MHNIKGRNILLFIGILFIIICCEFGIGIPCFFNKITGLYCPGCGITRACFSLLKLDIYQAFRYNMLFIILLPLLIIYFIYKVIFKGNKKIPNIVWNCLLIFTISFGILRNIPSLSFLAPNENLNNYEGNYLYEENF